MRRIWLMPLVCVAAIGAGCGGSAQHVVQERLFAGSGGICARGNTVRFHGLPAVVASPPPTVCDGGIPLRGFDLGRLTGGTRWHGLTTGVAYVEGVYRNGALTVKTQGAPRREHANPLIGGVPRDARRRIEAAETRLETAEPRDGIYEVDAGTSRLGRPLVLVRVMLVTPQLRALLRTMPPSLVRVLPTLRRVGSA